MATSSPSPGSRNVFPIRAPFVTSARTTLSTTKRYFQFDSTKFGNKTQRTALLDEIRFVIRPQFPNAGPYVWIRLRYGSEDITGGYIPLWMLDSRYNFEGQQGLNTGFDPGAGAAGEQWNYVWRLPKPLVVPRMDTLILEVKLADDYLQNWLDNNSVSDTTFNTPISVGYAMRELEDSFDPNAYQYYDIPYIAHYETPLFSMGTQQKFRTTQNDLANPFTQSFNVDRFTGMMMVHLTDTTIYPRIPVTNALIRMQNSLGGIVIRDPTPFQQVFPGDTTTFQTSVVIPSKNYYIMQLDVDTRSITSAPSGYDGTGNSKMAAHVAMIGTRAVDTYR